MYISPIQGNLLRGIDKKTLEEREFQFVHLYSVLSNTILIRKQNGLKLHFFIYNFFEKSIDQGTPDQLAVPFNELP